MFGEETEHRLGAGTHESRPEKPAFIGRGTKVHLENEPQSDGSAYHPPLPRKCSVNDCLKDALQWALA